MATISKKGAEEARNQLPSLLEAAERGRATVITKHGKPVAALVPIEDFKAASGTSDAQGNRAWTCEFRRAYIIEDPGTDGNGWSTVAGRRQWTPPNGYFLCGYDPAYDSDSQTALASVIGGLVRVPVIAVPTSVGYGANFGGLAALLAMLNSCATGVSVVNIDNGFGAAAIASAINHL